MWAILLIIAGVLLRANEQWFNGAETAGTIALVAGCICVAIAVLFWVVGLLAVFFGR